MTKIDCVSRKEGKRLASPEVSVDTSIRRLEAYIKMSPQKSKVQRPETTQTIQGSTEQQRIENKNGKKKMLWSFQQTNKQNLT